MKTMQIVMLSLIVISTTVAAVRNYKVNKFRRKQQRKKAAKEKPLDIGYDVNFEVHSNKNSKISRIANIKIINEFDPSGKDFETINEYLSLIIQVYSRTEKNTAIFGIYTLLNELLKTKISKEKIIFAKLKLKNIF